jgi:hypothetical protein
MGSSSTGKAILDLVGEVLFTGEVGLRRRHNLIGVIADKASNMISNGEQSFTSRLKL